MQYIIDILQYLFYNMDMKKPERMKFKLARIEKNLSQQELADMVGVTRQTIGLIEIGNYNPSLNLCIKLSKALGKTLDSLFWDGKDDE